MASVNGEVGFFEQHVEKFIIGIAAVIMIVAVFRWGLSSPHKVELKTVGPGTSKKVCSPEEVSIELKRIAERIDESIRSAGSKPEPIPNYIERLARIFRNPYPAEVRDYEISLYAAPKPLKTEWLPIKEVSPIRLADLQPLPRPEKPKVIITREVQVIPRQAGMGAGGPARLEQQFTYNEVDVAHAAGVFEFGKLLKHWQKVLEKVRQPARMIFVRVEVRRRRLLPDGSWSTPVPVKTFTMPDAPQIPEIPTPNGKNFLEIMQAMTMLARIDYQRYILEPPYYDIIWPDGSVGTWMIRNHKPITRVSKLLEQTGVGKEGPRRGRSVFERGVPSRRPGGEFGFPERRMRSPVERRRVPSRVERRRAERTIRRPSMVERGGAERGISEREARRSKSRRIPSPPRRLERPRGSSMGAGAERAHRAERGGVEVRASRGGERARSIRRGPERIERRGFERFPPARRRSQPTRVPITETQLVVEVPSLEEQMANPAGILEVWFHDQDGLEEGVSYSYSFRLVLVNPLVGQFSKVKDKQDAEVVTLATPWSEWSEPVLVKRPTEFFLVGHAPQLGTVEVDVFTQKWGQRVKSRFTVSRGEPIGGEAMVEIVRLDTRKPEVVKVSFNTGAIAVDFDFNRKQRIAGTNYYRTTTEMLYLDAEGRLCTRTEVEDINSPRYKELLQEVRQAGASIFATKE